MTTNSAHSLDHRISLVRSEITAFLVDRQARNLSPRTVQFYDEKLAAFAAFLSSLGISSISDLSADHVRSYLLFLESNGHNAGGRLAAYRSIKAFIRWLSFELDDPALLRLIAKIPAPRASSDPLPGVSTSDIRALLSTCDRSFCGQRDRAMLLTLLDTGLRKSEFVALDVSDLDLKSGGLLVRSGKGNKSRTVFVGSKARREITRYFRFRSDEPPLWLTLNGSRLSAAGLRQVLRRRADQAHVPVPQVHDFRRAFALESLRNGCDLVRLMRLMGHSSTRVLQRYLHLLDDDLRLAHQLSSPADAL